MTNCVLWGNSAGTSGDEIALVNASQPASLDMSYTDLPVGPNEIHVEPNCTLIWGNGNISADPCFADPNGPDGDPNTWEDNDYHLSPNSPCIDAGDPIGSYAGQTDIDGQGRKSGVVDMGSDEVWPVGIFYSLDLTYNPDRGTVYLSPNLPSYPAGSVVWLTGEASPPGSWNRWTVYDPNFPGDPNHITDDANNPVMIVMNADRQVQAIFNCGLVTAGMFPMMLGVLGLFVVVRRRR